MCSWAQGGDGAVVNIELRLRGTSCVGQVVSGELTLLPRAGLMPGTPILFFNPSVPELKTEEWCSMSEEWGLPNPCAVRAVRTAVLARALCGGAHGLQCCVVVVMKWGLNGSFTAPRSGMALLQAVECC